MLAEIVLYIAVSMGAEPVADVSLFPLGDFQYTAEFHNSGWKVTEKWLKSDWKVTEKWLKSDWKVTEKW